MSDLRERVARAICAADEQNGGPPWEWFIATKHKTGIEQHLERADAAIAIALEEAARTLEGWGDIYGKNAAAAIRAMLKGWPKCCGYTMTIDSPEERATRAAITQEPK